MYREVTINEFIRATSSSDPVPGGGGVAALCGSLAVALAQMVAHITADNKKYADVKGDMLDLVREGELIKKSLLSLIDKDADAFSKFMNSLKLPKYTDEEKQYRSDEMQKALRKSAQIPMEVAQTAYKVMDLSEIAIQKGNPSLVTDGLIAAVMCRSAVISSILNVRINLKSIEDEQFVADMVSICDTLEKEVKRREFEILEKTTL